MKLRPYQEEAKKAIFGEWQNGHRKTLLILPTGCGKTIVFSSVAQDIVGNKTGNKVLILAHRNELLEQAANKMAALGLNCAAEKGNETALDSIFPVTVSSVQTFARENRLSRFPKDYYRAIIVDEAHHALSVSYQKILEYFNNANVLGVTATPDRGDRKNLGKFFDSVAYEYGMRNAIKDGYLVPIKAQMIPLQIDLSKVRITAGDYSADDAGEALDPYLDQITVEIKKYCRGRRTVIFLPLIRTSQKLCNKLRDAGLRAAEVNGGSTDRKEILSDFADGKIDILCNSMLLTEGWDCPPTDCIIVLRPTKSRALYQQMIGRGTRPSPGKEDLLILDFLWLAEKHDLCRPSSLVCETKEITDKVNTAIEKDDRVYDLLESEEQAQRDVIKEREEALAKQLKEMQTRKRKLVDPLQYAISICAEDLADYEPTFAWEMEPPSKKQLEALNKYGIYADEIPNKGMASLLIGRLHTRRSEGMSTPKQIRLLEKMGFKHVGEWDFADASMMIDAITKNGWKVPSNIFYNGTFRSLYPLKEFNPKQLKENE